MPADASSPIPLAFDQLREHPGAVPGEIPGPLERLAEVPDPRDPRGVRHVLVVMLALTACAVLTGATSLPAEATVRRLLGRIDGDALDRAVGRWPADRRAGADGRLRAGGRRQDSARSGQGHGPQDGRGVQYIVIAKGNQKNSTNSSNPFPGSRSRCRAGRRGTDLRAPEATWAPLRLLVIVERHTLTRGGRL
ncbi:transposase family protein [Streptomyces mirabilis]|uniref:transposase family protein n=1 Tax=Streptomyces mirabilis TaxID=68239 RepID=UPI0033ECBEDA